MWFRVDFGRPDSVPADGVGQVQRKVKGDWFLGLKTFVASGTICQDEEGGSGADLLGKESVVLLRKLR